MRFVKTEEIVSGLRCCYEFEGGCSKSCPFSCVPACKTELGKNAANRLEFLAAEVERLKSLVQPVGRNPCDGCDHGWGTVAGYKNGKVETKTCMEECQLLKEYLEKQKEGQPCCL